MTYDQDYQTPDYFGEPFPELITFFQDLPTRGLVIDMGCGQGRNAIPLARMGFEVVGLDLSSVGVDQMTQTAKAEGLPLKGIVTDIYSYTDLQAAQVILLDSMFHFLKKDKAKETDWIKSILSIAQQGCLVVFCIQDSGKKVNTLKAIIANSPQGDLVYEQPMIFRFRDKASGHQSTSAYCLIVTRISHG